MGKFNNFLRQNQKTIGNGFQAIGGGVGLASQWSSMANEADSINTSAPEQQLDYFGKPQYNLGEATINAININPQGAGADEILSGAAQGAAAGSAFGAPGAIIGGAIGAIGSAIFGGARKSEMEKKKQKAINSLRFAQAQYNKAQDQFNIQNSGMQMYNQMNDLYSREANIYKANNNY